MKKLASVTVLALAAVLMTFAPAGAHFGMIIPGDQMIDSGESKTVPFELLFWHPFEGKGMELEKPKALNLVHDGKTEDLLGALKEKKFNGHLTWSGEFKVTRPGLYVLTMEPQPYYEPAEEKFIIHLTKAYVTAFGEEEGWDQPVGLKTEIVPLSKPYGLYAGNVFQGQVLMDGKPVPGAEVEVEYYNNGQEGKAPGDVMVTQTVKADPNGIFTYAAPKAGWWGFAALNTADEKMKFEGQDKDIELGAVIWVQFHEMK